MILYQLLGKMLRAAYDLCGDYLAALVIFTFFTKVIMLPVSIAVQKNGIKMVKMTPELNNIKCDYFGDKERINEETLKLYKREHYSLLLSLVPLILQLVLLMGVLTVVRDPQYSGISSDRMVSCGIDLSLIPVEKAGAYLIFPLAAALSALILCIGQNRSQVLQSEQGKLNKYGMAVLSTALSLYLGFFVSAGVVVYWISSNIMSLLQIYLLNLLIDPKKHIDYEAIEKTRSRLDEMSSSGKSLTKEEKRREKEDYKRFFSVANKHIVFYSESNGFYKYFRRLINWLITHSNIKIHYVTSDPNDHIFELAKNNPQIIPYFIGETRLITLFMKMDARIVVMTMPDLDNFHIKRSYVSHDVEYIYLHHGIASINMTTRKGSIDHFDTIFCTGPHVRAEMRAQERIYGIPKRTLVDYGYGMLEDLSERVSEIRLNNTSESRYILLAPSHQKDNILDSCLDNVVEGAKRIAHVIIRPHPQYVRRFPDKWQRIVLKYENDPDVTTESDFSSDETIYKAQTVITDWSNIVFEYAFSTLRPVLFVDTPMKTINPDYAEIGVEPVDISIRSRIGKAVDGKSSDAVYEALRNILDSNDLTPDVMEKARDEMVYNFMHSDEAGGKYILSRLKKQS